MLAFSILVAALWPALAAADVQSLSGLSWTLKNTNGSIVVPAKVPSQAHLDLLDAGIITEPLLGINGTYRAGAPRLSGFEANRMRCCGTDFSQRWIINDDWTYTADLTPLTQNMSADARALLVFFGIDTIANIVRRCSSLLQVSTQQNVCRL